MKAVKFVVIFALCINFAYTSSIHPVYNEAVAEGTADTKGNLLVLSADEASALEATGEDAIETLDSLVVPLGGESLDDVDGIQPRSTRSCTANVCRELCRRLGFRFFRCSGSWCICSR